MKTLCWIFSVACVFLNVGVLSVYGQQSDTTMQTYRAIEEKLAHINNNSASNDFAEIAHSIEIMPPRKDDQEYEGNAEKKLVLWIRFLGAIDSAMDYSFEASNVPSLNIAPETVGGIVYDSGIDPEAVKDPDAREKYKARLAQNQLKAKHYEQQTDLRRVRAEFLPKVGDFIGNRFSGDRVAVVNRIVMKEFSDPDKQARIKAMLARKW